MEQKVATKRIILFFIIFLIIITSIGFLFYINIEKHKSITVEALVKYIGDDYIIVVDEENQEYFLPTEDDYSIGDKVSAVIKDIKKDSNPKKGTVIKIDTLSKTVQFTIIDPKTETEEETKNQEETPTTNDSQQLETNNNTQLGPTTLQNTDAQVVAYFENLNQNLDSNQTDQTFKSKVKNSFITIVDFLFYDGQIHGKTFDELSESAKLQVLKLAYTIDEKIEKHFPNYKEELSNNGTKLYTNIKVKVLETYLDLSSRVCVDNQSLCDSAKEGLSDLKQNFSLTWELIKDMSSVGISKLKDWYEVWKDAE